MRQGPMQNQRRIARGLTGMFDITRNQLQKLDGEALRELVGRLCEAEMVKDGLPVSVVQCAGAHTAADGGLDVEVVLEDGLLSGDFVPRARTGFQVKGPTMPPSRIPAEMSPNGQLRPIFGKLAQSNGCYIIVSLADNPSRYWLDRRLKSIREQLAPVKDIGDLQVEFYGCETLCQWLRQHPGVQLWIREHLGIPLRGWRPFGRWTILPPGDCDQLICADGVSIVLPVRNTQDVEIEEGVCRIRELVRTGDKAVRIIGLSGVGKTRIIQALFEPGIGTAPLDRSLAIYADLGEPLTPAPRDVLRQLVGEGRQAVIVLDNCPPDVHDSLAGPVAAASGISLVTVEYDVRDDKPELTSVVKIRAEGSEIAKILVRRRYRDIGDDDAQRIAEFSGGNARLALALANAVHDEESLTDLSDGRLFERLFRQRGPNDTDLLATSEVLSLVYSFSTEHDEGGVDELGTLARLLGKDRRELYRTTQILIEKQLAQKRGRWRAVLPPAVSNRLAAAALRKIPVEDIRGAFESLQNSRLVTSFAKRLGYLHDHEVARGILRLWLEPDGILHQIEDLSDVGLQLLQNVAPADPGALLTALEERFRIAGGAGRIQECALHGTTVKELLCKIAYDPKFFKRSVRLLIMIALSRNNTSDPTGPRARLFGLFAIRFSGTEAGPEIRLPFLRAFLARTNSGEQELGFGMLQAALGSDRWVSIGQFDFGARPRNYGYWARTTAELEQWFGQAIDIAVEVALSGSRERSERVRKLLADRLRDLWRLPRIREKLLETAKSLNSCRPWLEGWKSVHAIRFYDYSENGRHQVPSGLDQLNEMEELLRPNDLAGQIRTRVLARDLELLAMDGKVYSSDKENWDGAFKRADDRAFTLGLAAAYELQVVDELSHEFFSLNWGRRFAFGQGLASGCTILRELWTRMVLQLERNADTAHDCGLSLGILDIIRGRNRSLAEDILDEAVGNPVLRRFIVQMQIHVELDQAGVQRLLNCLDFDDTPLQQYASLAYRKPREALDEADLGDILLKLLDRPFGSRAVIHGLSLRFHALKRDSSLVPSAELREVGLRAATQSFLAADGYEAQEADHDISNVLEACIDDIPFAAEINDLYDAFFTSLNSDRGTGLGFARTATALASGSPHRFLDRAFNPATLDELRRQFLFRLGTNAGNPLSVLGTLTLLEWCRQGDFHARISALAESIEPFVENKDTGTAMFSTQARAIIDAVDDVSGVLACFAGSISSGMNWGDPADTVARRRRAFEDLRNDSRPEVRNAAEAQIRTIAAQEMSERRTEPSREWEQTFE